MKIYFLALLLTASAWCADLFVNPGFGIDTNSGSKDAPFATAQMAVHHAQPGDTIHLFPKNAVYHQSIRFNNKSNLIIEGNGVTLDCADPLPIDGWENLGADLWRRKLLRTHADRHLLIINGKAQRMGRTTSNSDLLQFPATSDLQNGQFSFEVTDQTNDTVGWLILRGTVENLSWATRINGLATSGECSNLIIRNLNARHALNDGFNIHGHATGLKFENITGYNCFDEGFSVHDTSECQIDGGHFWGCENAITDVNYSITHYRNCIFRDSISIDVRFSGLRHSLTDCLIQNTTDATALSTGLGRDKDKDFRLQLTRVRIQSTCPEKPAHIRIECGKATIIDSQFSNTTLNSNGAEIEVDRLILNDEPVKDTN